MRRGRILIILAVILLIGLVLAFLALQRLGPSLLGATPTPVTVQVYYAAQNIDQGETVSEDRLGTHTLPQDQVTEDMFTLAEKGSLVGKVAKYPISQGRIISSADVGDAGQIETGGPQWASLIPVGMNAIAVPTSRLSSVAFGVQDGAHVNVTACMLMVDVDPSFQTLLPNHVGLVTSPINVEPGKMPGISLGVQTSGDPAYQGRTEVEPAFQQGIYVIPSEPQRPRLVCQMILQDVQVLKLGTFNYQQQAATNSQQPQPTQQSTQNTQPPDIITLVVTPQDAVTLTYLMYANVQLNLALRRGGDTSRQATEATTLQFLLSQYNIPVPVKLAYGMMPRIDALALPFLPNDVVTVSPNQGQ